MDPVVTARVPAGVRQRGQEVLREIGSNTSELINAAFAYVIQERKLPKAKLKEAVALEHRKLGATEKRELARFFREVQTAVPQEQSDTPFEQLLEDAMKERYANLS